jgi:nitrogen-specific signal transduction histidine kinase
MRQITILEGLLEFFRAQREKTKEAIQTIIDSFEKMQELIDELSVIPEEKERFFYVYYNAHYILRKVKYKRLWKRQKIP